MDNLYIGEIPLDYKYAVFSSDYITLYNKPSASNETLNFYRVYINVDGFYYTTGSTNFPSYNVTYFQEIPVTNNWLYRRDIPGIFTCSFIACILFVFVFNIVTSVFKKGGVFGGLL